MLSWVSSRSCSESQLSQADDFMLIDYNRVLVEDTPEAAAECEWLLVTASRLVEREADRLGISEYQLLQRRHEIESMRVQRALDVLDAGGFIPPDLVD
jgi:hypothetical protein